MSSEKTDEKTDRGPLEVPRLAGEPLKFAENILAIGMPYDHAVRSFLDSFPEFLAIEGVSEAEVFEQLGNRFRRMRRDTRRVSYHKIKETQATLKEFLDCIPIASPLQRLLELEILRQDTTLKCQERLKVLGAAAREVEQLVPRERTSPFLGLLPDLIPTQTANETREVSPEPQRPDPFGGAMMKNVDTGQETPEDS